MADGAVDDADDAADGGDERAEVECGRGVPGAVGADDAEVLLSEEVAAVEGELGVASDDEEE